MHASSWMRAAKPSRPYAFTLRIGLEGVFPRVFICLTHQPTDARTALRDYGLSKNKLLRSLEIAAGGISLYPAVAHRVLKGLLSSITSSAFSDVVIALEDSTIHNSHFFQKTLFKVLQRVHEVRSFRLVFCLEIWDRDLEDAMKRLKGYIDAEEAVGGLRFFRCPPVIISDNRAKRSAWEGLRV